MNTAGKLAAFVVVLGGALGGGAALGTAVGPIDVDDDTGAEHGGHASADSSADSSAGAGSADHTTDAAAAREREGATNEALPGGVLVSQDGYTLVPERTTVDGAPGERFRFRIVGPDGTPVRGYEVAHERELHLIVVGRDLQAYAHLHPTRGPDGTWTAPLPALAPGAYRAFADFAVADGPELTLGVDLTVPGASQPAPPTLPATTTTVDGYDVTLTGAPDAGTASELTLSVSRDGAPVTDLAPYLGAAGHLVAIRAGDLAYLHVHPLDEAGAANGPRVRFSVEVPSPGDYRLFFDFSHGGVVRTAAFTVHVPTPSGGETGETGDTGHTGVTTAADPGHSGHDATQEER